MCISGLGFLSLEIQSTLNECVAVCVAVCCSVCGSLLQCIRQSIDAQYISPANKCCHGKHLCEGESIQGARNRKNLFIRYSHNYKDTRLRGPEFRTEMI